jgi:hypothetical protein
LLVYRCSHRRDSFDTANHRDIIIKSWLSSNFDLQALLRLVLRPVLYFQKAVLVNLIVQVSIVDPGVIYELFAAVSSNVTQSSIGGHEGLPPYFHALAVIEISRDG